jgi:hypothetical protein
MSLPQTVIVQPVVQTVTVQATGVTVAVTSARVSVVSAGTVGPPGPPGGGGGAAGVSSFNARTGAVTLTTADVTGALGYVPVPPARQVLAGTGLVGGGDLSADRTLSMPNVGTAGTYGDAGTYPVVTTDAQGRVSGVTTPSLLAWLGTRTTADLPEGPTRLYYTDERVDDRVAALLVPGPNIGIVYDDAAGTLTVSATGLVTSHSALTGLGADDHAQYHTDARALTWLGTRSTSDLPEGTRLYYTDERVDDRVAALLVQGANVTLAYNDAAGTLTVSAAGAVASFNARAGAVTLATADVEAVLPVSDATALAKGSLDATKRVRLEVDGLTAGVTRVVTVPDADGTLVYTSRSVLAGTGLAGGGDLSADRTLSLPAVGTAGTYGDATHYPVLTTDAQGRVTAVTTQALPAAGVTSFNTRTGAVALLSADVTGALGYTPAASTPAGLRITTSDTAPTSPAAGDVWITDSGAGGAAPLVVANALSELTGSAATARTNIGAAPLASPTFTGTPAAPTAAPGTSTTQLATTAFVAAAAPPDLFKVLSADAAGANSATAQPWFPAAGAVSLAANTTYFFDGWLWLARSAGVTSHTTGISFGGTATLTNIDYLALASTVTGNALAAVSSIAAAAGTTVVVTAASTSATENVQVRVRGVVRVNAAGTFIPQFIFSAAPGGASTVKRGSFFLLRAAGDGAVVSVGTWA